MLKFYSKFWKSGCCLGLLSAAIVPLAIAKEKHHAHEHGSAKLDIAVENTVVKIGFEVPADSIFGFEHAATSDADKKTLNEALKTARERAAEMFVFASEKACKATEVNVKSSQEEAMKAAVATKAKPAKKAAKSEHADVDMDYTFTCASPLSGSAMKPGLMKLFPRLKKIDVQILSGEKQSGMKVTSAEQAIGL